MRLLPWQRTSLWLTVFMVIITIPFWLIPLDLIVSDEFYTPEADRSFADKYEQPWSALYKLVPVLSVLVVLGSLGLIAFSYLTPKALGFRRPAMAVFLTFLLGPGLVVNGVFKEYYGRPRPSQVENFGGQYPYVLPLVYGGYENAKSFPSGHSSVGFAFIIFFLLWRKRRPLLAMSALVGTFLLGASTGLARIVGGGHFLSDVLWSFYMVTVVALFVHYWIIERPKGAPQPANRKQKKAAIIGSLAFSVLLVIWGLLSIPFEKQMQKSLSLDGVTSMVVQVKKSKVDVVYGEVQSPMIRIEIDGYGLAPFVKSNLSVLKNGNELTLILEPRGFYREARQHIEIKLPVSLKSKLKVQY